MSSSETAFLPVKVQISFGGSDEVSLLQNFFFFSFSLSKLISKLQRKKILEWLNLHIFSLKKEKHIVDFHVII